MEIESTGLRTLLALARAGTFEAAAADLGITPSAVSQRIKALEQRTGRVLVHRTKPVTATRAGEVLVRLGGQLELLEREALAELVPQDAAPGAAAGGPGEGPAVHVPLVINADTLSSWILPALVEVQRQRRVAFEILREDEAHTTETLRRGDAMAAVTSDATPVGGCRVVPLGVMRYHALATPAFRHEWFRDGVDAQSLARAPVIRFDRRDTMQHDFVRRVTGEGLRAPAHYVPSAWDFEQAVRLGLGWGMVPEVLVRDDLADGRLVELVPGRHRDIPLYWQHWQLESALVDLLTEAVVAAAATVLRRPR